MLRYRLDTDFDYLDTAKNYRRSLDSARRSVRSEVSARPRQVQVGIRVQVSPRKRAPPAPPASTAAAPARVHAGRPRTAPAARRSPSATAAAVAAAPSRRAAPGPSTASGRRSPWSQGLAPLPQSARPSTAPGRADAAPFRPPRLRDRQPPRRTLAPAWAGYVVAPTDRHATAPRAAAAGARAAALEASWLATLPATLPTDHFFDASARLDDPTSPIWWTGGLHRPAARCFIAPAVLHAGRTRRLRRTTVAARTLMY